MVGVSTSSYCIARIIGTSIGVITANWGVRALSGGLVASIGCAAVGVVAVHIFSIKTFVKGTEPNLAFVGACCILCCKIDRSILASLYNVASVSSARIAVITRDCIVMDGSSGSITIVLGTCIFVINIDVIVEASIARIASINSARVAVITNNRSRNTSFYNIARVFGAFVCISAINRSMNTLACVAVARVKGTCIVIVTVNISVDAFSRVNITSNGLARFCLADNWSVNTVSVRARISCAQVVVVTNFISILASFYCIARSNRAFVSVITNNRSVLDSIFNGASISGTCIVIVSVNSSVLATRNRIASINSARVTVITVNWCVDACFKIIRASINGANVVIIAMSCSNISKDTSSCRIARFVGARVLIITNDCIVFDVSSGSITIIDGAFVVVINVNWSKDAFSRSLVAGISCAWVLIITSYRSFHNSGVAITSNEEARVAVINRNCNVLAAKFCIARISGTCVAIITRDWGVLASGFCVTGIKSTNVIVITVNCNVLATLFLITSISGTCILVITNNRRVNTSSCWVTVIVGTCIIIVAINCNVKNFSSENVTLFSSAFVVIAKLFRSIDASSNLVTSVVSARIVVAASNRGIDASFNSIARINSASVVIITIANGMLASKSWAARIYSTCISIITIFLFSVVTNSIDAFVNGAEIVISTYNTSVNALVGFCITSINSARVTIIATVNSRL
jgi:predicted thioesterase